MTGWQAGFGYGLDGTGAGQAARRFGLAARKPFARVGRRAGMWAGVHTNEIRAVDGVFGLLWINYIFNEFERLRNKIC